MSDSEFDFPIGKVVGFRGLRGQIKIRCQTNNPALLIPVKNIQIRLADKSEHICKINDLEIYDRLLTITLNGFPDRTSVEHFMNADVKTKKSELARLESEEWWVTDLIGLAVYDDKEKLVGTVCDVYGERGDVLEIRLCSTSQQSTKDGNTVLVPFVKEIVPIVDLKNKKVVVKDIPGLLNVSEAESEQS